MIIAVWVLAQAVLPKKGKREKIMWNFAKMRGHLHLSLAALLFLSAVAAAEGFFDIEGEFFKVGR